MTDSNDALIRATGLSAGYGGGEPVLAGVDLALSGGQTVVVLGPNGGGKTTLLKTIIGELVPAAGELAVTGDVAYLPQYDSSRLDFPVTALDVVAMGTLAERKPWQRAGGAVRERSLAALDRVGLKDRAKSSFGALSGGQRRRVLLARTIVQRSQIVALDEPLAGVDPASAEVIRGVLDEVADQGRLVLVTSHDLEHARASNRVLCVNGEVIADGDPAVVLTDDALRQTYASDLTIVTSADGTPIFAAAEHHHHHEH